MTLEIDIIMPKDASLGPYDVTIIAMTMYLMLVSSCHIMAPNYVCPHVEHRCEIPGLEHLPNGIVEMIAIPWDWPRMQYSTCDEYITDWSDVDTNLTDLKDISWFDLPHVNTTDSRSCSNGWMYDQETYGPTATSEWDLVCSRSWILEILSPMALVGLFIGSLVCGSIANRIGRRRAIVLFQVGLITSGTIASFSFTPEMLLCFRLLVGVFAASSLLVGCVLAMEIVPSQWRAMVAGVFNLGYGMGMILLTACAFFIRNFRFLQLAISLLGLPVLSYIWLLPESPRWLNSIGRVEEATRELAGICRKNKRIIPENLLYVTARTEKYVDATLDTKVPKPTETTGSYIDLLRHPTARKYIFIISLSWAVANFTFMGVSLNMSGLFGDPYLNGVISGVIEIVIILVATVILQRVNRKAALVTLWVAVAAAGFLAVPFQILNIYPEMVTACALFARSTASAMFAGLYVVAGELFPTSLRSAAIGIAAGTGHIVSLVAPFICGPAVTSLWPWLPNSLYGIMCVLVAIMTSGLAETQGRDLPNTLEDMERMATGEFPNPDPAFEKGDGVMNFGFKEEECMMGYYVEPVAPETSFRFDYTGYHSPSVAGVFVISKGEQVVTQVSNDHCVFLNDIEPTFVTRM